MCISVCAFPMSVLAAKIQKKKNGKQFFFCVFYLWLVIRLSICGHIRFQFGFFFSSSCEHDDGIFKENTHKITEAFVNLYRKAEGRLGLKKKFTYACNVWVSSFVAIYTFSNGLKKLKNHRKCVTLKGIYKIMEIPDDIHSDFPYYKFAAIFFAKISVETQSSQLDSKLSAVKLKTTAYTHHNNFNLIFIAICIRSKFFTTHNQCWNLFQSSVLKTVSRPFLYLSPHSPCANVIIRFIIFLNYIHYEIECDINKCIH